MRQRPCPAPRAGRDGADDLQHAGGAQFPAGRPLAEEIEWIEGLAERIARLTISRTDPHHFFEERDEIAKALQRLAREKVFRR